MIEDSDHQMGHVLSNLEAYAGLVSPGSYYVVQVRLVMKSHTPTKRSPA